jgi:rubredoxin
MKCAACGYEYDPAAKEEWDKPDGHGGSHFVSHVPFEDFFIQIGLSKGKRFYICPVCGTVRAD